MIGRVAFFGGGLRYRAMIGRVVPEIHVCLRAWVPDALDIVMASYIIITDSQVRARSQLCIRRNVWRSRLLHCSHDLKLYDDPAAKSTSMTPDDAIATVDRSGSPSTSQIGWAPAAAWRPCRDGRNQVRSSLQAAPKRPDASQSVSGFV